MKGEAISLVGPKDIAALTRIEAFLRQATEYSVVEGLQAKFDGKAKTSKMPAKVAATKKKTDSLKASKKTTKKPSAKPAFFQGGDDGSLPVKRKQK